MTRFFELLAAICLLLFLATLGLGHFGAWLSLPFQVHLLVGLGTGLLTVAAHCLIFGIFTGAGKDTRELVQDLKLDSKYTGSTKAFRSKAFPPALYAILLVVLTTCFGGALSSGGSPFQRWVHLLLAWATFFYNVKAFRLEARCVRENAAILAQVNRVAGEVIEARPEEAKAIPEIAGVIPAATEALEWGTHVYALGKFLCFLGWNAWLPFLYLKYVVGYFTMPVWPYAMASLGLLGLGYYLRFRYQTFRPIPLGQG